MRIDRKKSAADRPLRIKFLPIKSIAAATSHFESCFQPQIMKLIWFEGLTIEYMTLSIIEL
jgi:hypothetical protein